jgi:hypothetical protein
MFSLRLRFQTVASRLNISDLTAKDLNPNHLLNVAKKYIPQRVNWAIKKRYDLQDPVTLWEIFSLDGVISLENQDGKLTRVAVSLVEDENKAYNLLHQAKAKPNVLLRKELNIEQYWVLVVKWKNFPEDGEWIDLLYQEIDETPNSSGCRVINLA